MQTHAHTRGHTHTQRLRESDDENKRPGVRNDVKNPKGRKEGRKKNESKPQKSTAKRGQPTSIHATAIESNIFGPVPIQKERAEISGSYCSPQRSRIDWNKTQDTSTEDIEYAEEEQEEAREREREA